MSAREFDRLTPRGQLLRLRALTLEALREYDFSVRRIEFVAARFNTVFRVEGANGDTYAMRVSPRLRIHADGCEETEAAWVGALHDAGLPLPRVIPATGGSTVVWVTSAGVAEPRSCVLFEWVGGRPLRERLTAGLVHATGVLHARVHDHGAAYAGQRPAGALVADRVLYFRCEPRLDELRPEYGSALADGLDRAQETLDDLWRHPPHPPHLLHGDVQPGNVMVSRGRVTLIDFQDLIWGFEIQDVEIAHHALAHSGDDGGLAAAYRAGYETVRPWPAADGAMIAALRAARHLNVLNLGLNQRKPGLDEFVARHAVPVVEWMRNRETG